MTDSRTALAVAVAEPHAAAPEDASPGAGASPAAGPGTDPADGRGDPAAPAYPALLDALHASVAPGRLVASAAGHVLASRAALPHVPDDGGLARFGAAWTKVAMPGDAVGGGAGNGAGRWTGADPSDGRISTAATDREQFARGLLALHCGLLRDVLRHAMAWLDARTAEGSSLLARQLNQGACADAAVEIAECEAMCADPAGVAPETAGLISRRLTETGRSLLGLLGASGFVADRPAADVYLAELADNVYLHPGTE